MFAREYLSGKPLDIESNVKTGRQFCLGGNVGEVRDSRDLSLFDKPAADITYRPLRQLSVRNELLVRTTIDPSRS